MKDIKANLRDIKDSVKSFNIYIFKVQNILKRKNAGSAILKRLLKFFKNGRYTWVLRLRKPTKF